MSAHVFVDETRKKILDAVTELEPSVTVYGASALPGRQQREACLRALVADVAAIEARMLVLERDDSIADMDNRVLYQQIREHGCLELRYQHLRAHEEPLLAIPDAVAWCWQRGGAWRQRVRDLVAEVRTLPK
ncbi:hypothetical protein [Actinocrispum sp. NPDC049592]|uniref:hypothetical protein n=1 Tax=Actinocrispum sp. NPDC049592 TaxID=3154835 RepID=UPI003440D576